MLLYLKNRPENQDGMLTLNEVERMILDHMEHTEQAWYDVFELAERLDLDAVVIRKVVQDNPLFMTGEVFVNDSNKFTTFPIYAKRRSFFGKVKDLM